MKNANLPNVGDLPTLRQLNRATALAFGVAVGARDSSVDGVNGRDGSASEARASRIAL